MDQYLLQISGMRCNACSAKVHSALLSIREIESVEVHHQLNSASISVREPLEAERVQLALGQAGDFTLAEMRFEGSSSAHAGNVTLTTGESDFSPEEPRSQSLFPLFLIVGYISFATVLVAWSTFDWSVGSMMRHFMAGFFLVFSFFKLLDAPGFASAFKMYDPMAKFIPGWAWIYPYVELLLGVAYLMSWQPFVTNAITFVLMSVGGVGVLQSLQQKRTIRCACLGTALNLPMTKVTLVENGTMALMAAFMLAGCAGPPQSASYPLLGIENASSVQLTILSLNGDTYPSVYSTGTDASGEDRLHGWLVLQSCPLEQTAQSMRLLRSINADMAQGYKGIPVDCFQPRHAIRISTTDSLTEYLICYQCHNYQCWVDGSRVGSGGIADHSAEIFDRLLITCSASSGQ